MLEKAITTIKKNNMISRGDKILVGVSGGPDSIALLLVLSQLSQKFGCSLVAAHLNHGMRDKDADSDEAFVKELTKKMNIPLATKKVDIPARQKKTKGSLEEVAREARYDFFSAVAKRRRCTKVALGHNLDDNAETVLMNMLRGSGVKGLGGIPPKRLLDAANVEVIRPLITVSREQIIQFLKEQEQEFCVDATNEDTAFTRNKIRHELIPMLQREYNPGISCVLNETAHVMRDVDEYIESEIQHKQKTLVKKRDDEYVMRQSELLKVQPFIRREVIRRTLHQKYGLHVDLSMLDDVHEFISSKKKGSINISDQVTVTREYSNIVIDKFIPVKEDFSKKVKIPGTVFLGFFGTQLSFEILDYEPGMVESRKDAVEFAKTWEKIRNGRHVNLAEYFDADKLTSSMIVCNRKEGDRYQPIGLEHEKTVKAIMIDEKIPVSLRSKVPLMMNGSDILWIMGYRISEKYKITAETRKVLKVEAKIFYCNEQE